MCGCSSCATVRASRTNRTASDGEGVRPRSMTLTATSRFNGCSRTRNTAANPPSPSRSPTVNSFPRACCRRRRSVTVSSDMTDAKPRNARRLALGIVGAALVWLLGVWPPPVWWRDHLPRETAMMRERRLELALSKDRILELYLSMAQWGPGLWGVEAASRAYFGVPPSRLDEAQAAALAATLPHPLTSTPTFRPDRTLARRDLILARYHGVDVYIPPEEEDTVLLVPPVIAPPIESLNVQLPVQADTAQDAATVHKDSS